MQLDKEVGDSEKSKGQLAAEIERLKKRIVELESAPQGHKFDSHYFAERLAEETARSTRYKYEFSILLTDMDNIDVFSNKYGEAAAEEIFAMFSVALNDTLRTTDIKCKLDKFQYAVILPYTDAEGGHIAAEKLRQAVERIFSLKSSTSSVRLTLSSSIASYPKNAVTAEHLMAAGKEALALAAAGGGNRVCLAEKHDDGIGPETGKKSTLRHNDTLMRALEDEVNRCLRYGQQFSFILLAVTSLEAKGLQIVGAVKTEILRTVFKLLSTGTRTVDKIYLYNDTRFAVILPHTGHEGAFALAEKLKHSLTGNPILRNDGADINISINIGLAAFPTDAISSEELIQKTEAALNHAIRNGANRAESASGLVAGSSGNGRDIKDLIASLKKTGPHAVYNFLAVVDVTEHYERPHSHFVAKYSMAAGTLMGLSPNAIRRLRVMALLHDLGKVCMPDSVLTKPGPLSDQEWDVMMKHPQYAADMLKQFPDFEFCCMPVLAHHERMDGKGYPRGLKGNEIPIESRIIAAVEAYDDMVMPRPYRQHVSTAEAIEELKNKAGSQFDAAVVRAFIRALSSSQSKV